MIGDTLFAYWDSDSEVGSILKDARMAAEISGRLLEESMQTDSQLMRDALAKWTGDVVVMVHGCRSGDEFTNNGPNADFMTAAELLPDFMPASTVVVLACNQKLATWTLRAPRATLVAVSPCIVSTAAVKQIARALLTAQVTTPAQFDALRRLLATRIATPEDEAILGTETIARVLDATDRRVPSLVSRTWETQGTNAERVPIVQSDGVEEFQK